MSSAVVVGSGPNGLAAALALALEGVAVTVLESSDRPGGGTRSSELTRPGVIHDDCSAFHPTGAGSPAFAAFGLEEHGLRWSWPELDLVHPLDDGSAGVMSRDLDRTAESLGVDGPSWRRLFQPLARSFDELAEDILQPLLRVPSHPLLLARFGTRALLPAAWLARRWKTPHARALFAGIAAHGFTGLHAPLSGAIGLSLTAAGHAYGWPVAEGGSGAITAAMVSKLTELGGRLECGVEVRSIAELGRSDVVMLDVSPAAAARILGADLPGRVNRAYRRYRYGPAAFKVDLAIEGHIPWTNPDARRAGTVHLGGTLEEVAAVEREVVHGEMPRRPFLLVGQQYLADPSRSSAGVNPIWVYAHVPHGFGGDATELVLEQIERFAPGFRDTVREVATRDTAAIETYNANYVGGDISCGANDLRQLIARPRWSLHPYRTGVRGVYLCSAATPPGAGVHGMCGYNAARAAVRDLAIGTSARP